jgi:hypothetical protein
MELNNNELVNISCALWLQMRHLPADSDHYKELDALYSKIIKETDDVKHHKKESRRSSV